MSAFRGIRLSPNRLIVNWDSVRPVTQSLYVIDLTSIDFFRDNRSIRLISVSGDQKLSVAIRRTILSQSENLRMFRSHQRCPLSTLTIRYPNFSWR